MKDHNTITDKDLLAQMNEGYLDPDLFNHEAHLRWGWLLLESFSLEEAIEKACSQLKHYTAKLGVSDKYNETVTVAAMNALQHFRNRSQKVTFSQFIKEFPRLKTSFKELMAFHYSLDIFTSAEAKDSYIEPDLLPFD